MEVIRDAVIVPAAAIQRGPQGTFVFIVKADQTVGMGPVTVGINEEGETSVTSGLSPGTLVVVEGVEKLRGGTKVELRQHVQHGGGLSLFAVSAPAAQAGPVDQPDDGYSGNDHFNR